MKFTDFMLFSKAIDKVKIKPFVKELNRLMEEGKKELKKTLKEDGISLTIEELDQKLNAEGRQIAAMEVMIFIGENLYKIEDELIGILQNNTLKSVEEIKLMEHKEIFEVLKSLFADGIPQALKRKMGLGDLDLKKTL